MADFIFDWSDLAFGSKRPVNDLQAMFIMAPRQLSAVRLAQLLKTYLPKGNLVIGLAREEYIDGFDGQPQFKTLQPVDIESLVSKVAASASPHKLYGLRYFQRETDYVIGKLKWRHVVLVNGSWQYAFHTRSTYYAIVNNALPYEHVSPFASEAEAKAYALEFDAYHQLQAAGTSGYAGDMFTFADQAARLSFDYSFQTGAALAEAAPHTGERPDGMFRHLLSAYNRVVPYQTYAMHHGAARERHFSPPNDLNHYDTVHAEVELIIQAQKQAIGLKGATVFINLLPCPPCARMLAETDIDGVVYREDHSNGYAVTMLEMAGKTVTRLT